MQSFLARPGTNMWQSDQVPAETVPDAPCTSEPLLRCSTHGAEAPIRVNGEQSHSFRTCALT
jgi:hypothetical protein